MLDNRTIGVVIPALNEELSIGKVLADIPGWVDDVVVADNGSTDDTIAVAKSGGAKIGHATQRGYGAACQAGIALLPDHDIIVFVDGDYSDYPQQMDGLVLPILNGTSDLVIGSRRLGTRAKGSLTLPQMFGNWLACCLIKVFWKTTFTDLGPFRAIARNKLETLNMTDQAFGWTVQMQLRAVQENLNIMEVPVDYRQRIGKSKISGTVKGTLLAGYAIIGTILVTAIRDRTRKNRARLQTK
ncbi:MAG: glycosyltransferase involved in cell wall biosynthesis [Planctomycetota bacterium]|jgi:glycosyltransferase involved in cell wall biosynthesis